MLFTASIENPPFLEVLLIFIGFGIVEKFGIAAKILGKSKLMINRFG